MIRSTGVRPWDHGAMERHEREGRKGAESGQGMHWGPLKSADRVQSREAMGALGGMGPCMEPWGQAPEATAGGMDQHQDGGRFGWGESVVGIGP